MPTLAVIVAVVREFGIYACRSGDNVGMGRNDSGDRLLGAAGVYASVLDGTRPSGIPQWVSPVAPAVTQAAIGGKHWAAGRPTAGVGPEGQRGWLRAGGVGPWHRSGRPGPRRKRTSSSKRTLMRKRGLEVRVSYRCPDGNLDDPPADGGTPWTSLGPSMQMKAPGVRSGLRRPPPADGARDRRHEAPLAVFYALRVPRAGQQRRRPRIAAASALVVAGAVARLRAASAEPLR